MNLVRPDFERLRTDYETLADFCLSNPIIPGILNNIAGPEELDGYVEFVIKCTPEYFIPYMFAALIESELVFVAQKSDPLDFLSERTRIASRILCDVCQSSATALLAQNLRDFVAKMYKVKIRDVQSFEKMSALLASCLDAIFGIDLPEIVNFAIAEVYELAMLYGFGKYACALCGNLILLRVICPMLVWPEFYGLADYQSGAPSYAARGALLLLGRLLREVGCCRGGARQCSDEFQAYEDVISNGSARFEQYISSICAAPHFPVKHFVAGQLGTTYIVPDAQESSSVEQRILAVFLPGIHTNVIEVGLRTLARLHCALSAHLNEIVDICAAVSGASTAMQATFERYIDYERFRSIYNSYSALWKCEHNHLSGLLTDLIKHVSAPLGVFAAHYSACDDAELVPRSYRVIKENAVGKRQNRIIRFTSDSFFNIEAEELTSNRISPFARHAYPLIKNEMTGSDVQRICANDLSVRIEFCEQKNGATIGKQQKRLPRVYYFEDSETRNQMLAELIEMCFLAAPKPAEFPAVWTKDQKHYNVQIRFGKDAIMLIDGDKIVYDAHLALIQSAEAQGSSVSIRLKGISDLLLLQLQNATTFFAVLMNARNQILGAYKPDLDTMCV